MATTKEELKRNNMNSISSNINSTLHIAHLNCKGIYSRLAELKTYISTTLADILCFTETWLSNKEPNFLKYDTYWKHRDRHGGSVGICVSSHLSSRTLNLRAYNGSVIEAIGV